ncbi:MAG: beta-ketoacyl-[acyl-carrier-protein] synthase family protein [Pseudomonadota bacterium]
MPQKPEPIAVLGFGCISALGLEIDQMRAALRAGRDGVSEVDFKLLRGGHVSIAAQITDFLPDEHFSKRELNTLDRFAALALVAAQQAVEDANIDAGQLKGPKTAVIVGSGIGGQTALDQGYEAAFSDKPQRFDPTLVPRIMVNAAASNIGMRYGCTGPVLALSTACASATQCVGLGLEMLRSGQVDLAVVGGAEAMATAYSLRTWEALRVLTPDRCRPFSRKRNGMVLGEGAGIFVLQRLSNAVEQGFEPKALLTGYGTSSDAVDLLRPDAEGAARAMTSALTSAACKAEQIDYINAHGTGTLANDANETSAIKLAFGDHAAKLAVSSTKAMHGHAIGAAGAIELAATLIALQDQFAPPTINWVERDPTCDLDYVPNQSRDMSIERALSNSFAFGGINACLVAERWKA